MNLNPQTGSGEVVADDIVYSAVYHILVAGMMLATALFTIGVILALARPGGTPFVLDSAHPYRLGGMLTGLLNADPISFMAVGTIVTILTPIARVVVSVVAFLRERDYAFVWITLFVLFTTFLSIGLGLLGFRT